MSTYHAEPNRAEPNSWMWYAVQTPTVFREYKLPVDDALMSRTHRRQYAELRRLAEAHGASITASAYRRG